MTPALHSAHIVVNAWRERGYRDGYEGRESKPPDEPADVRSAYLQGYRSGKQARATSP